MSFIKYALVYAKSLFFCGHHYSATDLTCHFLTCSDNSLIRVDRLEYHIREELNKTASRAMVVLNPLKVWSSVPAPKPHQLSKVLNMLMDPPFVKFRL